MTQVAFTAALRGFWRRVPFRPFMLHLHSGALLKIVHPEAIDLRGEAVVYRNTEGRYRIFDATSVCDFLEISDL
jgi:hypothetical protein